MSRSISWVCRVSSSAPSTFAALKLCLPFRFTLLFRPRAVPTITTSSSLATLSPSCSSSSAPNSPRAPKLIFLSPSRGVSTLRVCRRRTRPFSALGIVALKPRSSDTFCATPSGSGTSCSSSSSAASAICRSRDVTRREPKPSRSGARPSVAKSTFVPLPVTDARGRPETVAAPITRGLMMTGATAEMHVRKHTQEEGQGQEGEGDHLTTQRLCGSS